MREWRHDDAKAMHRWIGNAEVMRHLTWGTGSLSETETYLASLIARQRRHPRKEYFLAVETSVDSVVIGDAGFTWVSPGTVEIGYFLEPDQWGKGLGLEAARLIIDLATDLGAETIAATCFKDNWRSERVMQACGMTRQPHPDPDVLKYALSTPGNTDSRKRLTPSP
nr:GNAT family N-acetyltransferase [Labrenzia sp. VG12]